jgi:glutamate racemase
VASGAYLHAVEHAAMVAGRAVSLTSAACPGFVEFVERGHTAGDEVTVLAERLLAPVNAADVDALLLGCTHYPFLSRVIGDVVGSHVTLVSSADETAFSAARLLGDLGLLRDDRRAVGRHRFLSSGDVDLFRELGSSLLGPELDAAEPWCPGRHFNQQPSSRSSLGQFADSTGGPS